MPQGEQQQLNSSSKKREKGVGHKDVTAALKMQALMAAQSYGRGTCNACQANGCLPPAQPDDTTCQLSSPL